MQFSHKVSCRRLVLIALSAGTLIFGASSARAQQLGGSANQPHTLVFGTQDVGEKKEITHWGLDTALPDPNIVRRGILYTGRDEVDVIRVSFPIRFALENGELPAAADEHFATRLKIAQMAGDVPFTMLPDTEAGVAPWYKNGNYVRPELWVQLMASAQRKYGKKMESVEPFNEADYGWGQGNAENLRDILSALRQDPEFKGVQMTGPSTLNSDAALPWYNVVKTQLDRGSTHALGGGMESFVNFYQQVTKDGKIADNPELHSIAEAIAGAQYGMQSAIWWLAPELARGEFVKACQGERLAYAEDRPRWSAAAVYRAPGGQLQAFVGASERQGQATTYRFVARDRPVFFDGDGPRREYTATIRKDNERVINITWGADVQPKIEGRYAIVNRYSGKVLGVTGASAENGAAVAQMDYSGAANQQWEVAPLATYFKDQSYYAIRAVHSGKTLDLADYSYDEGAPVQQWGEGEGAAQNWYFEYAGNNNFRIRSRWSTQYLQPAQGSKYAGAAIVQTAQSGDLWQQWRLVPVSAGKIEFEAPQAPRGLSATPNSASVALKWTTNAENDVASYSVFRATSAGGAYDIIARGLRAATFTDNDVQAGQTYFYKVKATDNCLNSSGFSSPVSANPNGNAPLASYRFENSVSDASGNANALAAFGAPTYGLGRGGSQAIMLDGADDYLELPRAVAGARDITMAAWVYPQASEQWQRIFDLGNGESQYLFLSGNSGNGSLRLEAKNGAAEQHLEAPGLPGNGWSHVAFTLGGNTARLYVSGKLVASSDNWTIHPADFAPVFNYLGKSQFAADPLFKGRIDDVQIYNSALAPQQIAELASPATK